MKKQGNREVLYLAIDLSKYEYIYTVCDSLTELALWANCSITKIRYLIRYKFVDLSNQCRYIKVIC